MPTPITIPTLAQALVAMGNAHLYWAAGFPTVAGSVAGFGQKQGNIEFSLNEAMSELTAPEQTGPAVHAATVMGYNPVITIPLILGDPTLWSMLSPTGSSSAGFSVPQPVVTAMLAIIPDAEVGGGLSYDGTTWTRLIGNGYAGAVGAGAAPVAALWFWKGYFKRPASIPYSTDNGGKIIGSVVFQAMFDTARPEGNKLWTMGDPIAKGMPTFRL